MIERHVETLFCDDIRHEMGGKLSYIGVYSGGLYVTTFPVTLPKLCLSVKVITPVEQPLHSLAVHVLKDKETLQELVANEEQLKAASESSEEMASEALKERAQWVHFMLVFSPIQFEGPCILRVRVQTEDAELWGLALKVDQIPST